MKKIVFLDEARRETIDTAIYYEQQARHLGENFLEEVDSALKLIKKFPVTWPIKDGVRFCLINRFPYGIFYKEESETLLIIAVANLKRKPAYWKNRI